MELRQRKRINNIPRFNGGVDLSGTIKGIGGDITGLGAYKTQITSTPTTTEINNIKTPGKASSGGGFNASKIDVAGAVNGITGMISGYNSMQNAVKNSNELAAQSGQRTDQAFGVNYQAQNDINYRQAMDDVSSSTKTATLGMVGSGAAAGAAIGSAFPGLGTLIGGGVGAVVGLFGGLFGSKKAKERQRRKIFNAQQNVNLTNQINRSSAATEGLTQQYYADNGNTYDDVLYANRGKDLRKPRYERK